LGQPIAVLRMAFARHVLQELSQGKPSPSSAELQLMEQLCPLEDLRKAGLINEHGQFGPSWIEARAAALERLPRELSHEDKLDLLKAFFELTVVDGQLEREEGNILLGAATLLGIGPGEFDALLDTLTEHVGSIDLDAPEDPGGLL
jgi:uncharacterized tellurite resistance protein B-like protein